MQLPDIIKDGRLKKTGLALLLTLPMSFATYFVTGAYMVLAPSEMLLEHYPADTILPLRIGILVAWLFVNSMLFLMFYSGKTDKFRSAIFIAMAVLFPVDFIPGLFEQRGHLMTATFENIIHGEVPFCHIVMPQTLLSMLFRKEIAFPGTIAKASHSIGGMIILWVAATVAIGRGFCSWTCFYGGWEDGCSRIAKKARIKKLPDRLRLLPFAVLLAVALTSLATATAAYCWWLCPFKAVSEFVETDSWITWVQTAVFIILFAGLVIVLPLLSKKRSQCISLCPFGAMQSIADKINVFEIRIIKDKCTNCRKCIRTCPMNSIDEESLIKGKTGLTCVKCGRCLDECPQKAIVWHIKGTPVGKYAKIARTAFTWLAFTIIAAVGSGMIATGFTRIIHLAATGSIVY